MLRIENDLLRVILLVLSLIGIILFLCPLAARILNIGNMFGLACCLILLGFTVFNRQISHFLGIIDSHKAGKILLRVLGIVLSLTRLRSPLWREQAEEKEE